MDILEEVVVLVSLVTRDVRTTTGSNLHCVGEVAGVDPWHCSPKQVKQLLAERLVPMADQDK